MSQMEKVAPYALVALASLAALFVPAPAPARMATLALAAAAGLAASRIWHPRGAWIPSLVIAAGPTALLVDPIRLLLAGAVLMFLAGFPRAGSIAGLAAGFVWPPLGLLGAAHLPAPLLPLVVLPAVAAAWQAGSILLAVPYLLVALVLLGARLLRWVPTTPDSVHGLLQANLVGAGLLLVGATFLADQLAATPTPAQGVRQALALAVLVGLVAVQGAAFAVVHRAGDPQKLAWPAAGLGILVLASAALMSVNLRKAQVLGLALTLGSLQMAAVAPLLRLPRATWYLTMISIAAGIAIAAHGLPGAS